jgi:hypothetical protein
MATLTIDKKNPLPGLTMLMKLLEKNSLEISYHSRKNVAEVVPYLEDIIAYEKWMKNLAKWDYVDFEDFKKEFYTKHPKKNVQY